ncbi:MAG: hypothetical protein ABW123_06175 [Cystobacter sp.]
MKRLPEGVLASLIVAFVNGAAKGLQPPPALPSRMGRKPKKPAGPGWVRAEEVTRAVGASRVVWESRIRKMETSYTLAERELTQLRHKLLIAHQRIEELERQLSAPRTVN